MGRTRLIFDTYNIEKASKEMLKNIDDAIIATAFKLRDEARQIFINSSSIYKTHSSGHNYRDLAQGIMVGKLRSSQIKIHSLGASDNQHTYKTRFFVGGTQYRRQTKMKGKAVKPYQKGFIKPNETIDKAMNDADTTLNNYIKNAIEE